jgi:DNA-binding response OmpR family regulator
MNRLRCYILNYQGIGGQTMKTSRILVVDDDPSVRFALRQLFEASSFEVEESADCEAALRCMAKGGIDLVTLDIGMPGLSAIDFLRELRVHTSTPVIIVSGRSTDTDRIVGLEVGADDYVIKPFVTRELLARVRAVLRRYGEHLQATERKNFDVAYVTAYGRFLLNTRKRALVDERGVRVGLTSMEYALFEFLHQNCGQYCTRQAITTHLKGRQWQSYDRSLDTLVARLRKKIEQDPNDPDLLQSVRGIGYVLVAGENIKSSESTPPRLAS